MSQTFDNAGGEAHVVPGSPGRLTRRMRPPWRRPALFVMAAMVVIAAAAITWVVTNPGQSTAAITVTKVYVPPTNSNTADVYFTLGNTGAGSDTLHSVGAEYRTGSAAKTVTLCSGDPCHGAATIDIAPDSTTLFGPGGPHVEVTGLGALRKGHQPLQLTLTFERSGTLHILAPVGTAADLSMMDVMMYGFMGHAAPGDGMGMGTSGSDGPTVTPSTGMRDMPGMTSMAMPTATTPADGMTTRETPGMTIPMGGN